MFNLDFDFQGQKAKTAQFCFSDKYSFISQSKIEKMVGSKPILTEQKPGNHPQCQRSDNANFDIKTGIFQNKIARNIGSTPVLLNRPLGISLKYVI